MTKKTLLTISQKKSVAKQITHFLIIDGKTPTEWENRLLANFVTATLSSSYHQGEIVMYKRC